jgi:hypothetical protein
MEHFQRRLVSNTKQNLRFPQESLSQSASQKGTKMSAEGRTERIVEASPRFKARIAGLFYLLTFLAGGVTVVFFRRGLAVYGDAANIIENAFHIAVTLLFYDIFKPVNRSLSLLAACLSLMGCALEILSHFHFVPSHISPMAFFGLYCLLIGFLIFRSAFLPQILGVLIAIAGVCWLTFLSTPLANYLSPYNIALGALGEGSLMLWLLVFGVNAQRLKLQAGVAGASIRV